MKKMLEIGFLELSQRLKKQLEMPLPGVRAQQKTEPITRQNFNEKYPHEHPPRLSAVLILLYEDEGAIKTVFIERQQYDGVHSGQIAFPGGRFEKSDSSLIYTALREAHEEVGIQPQTVEVVGKLSNLFIPPSNFDVLPVIGITSEKPVFVADPIEVKKIIQVDLDHLLNPSNCRMKEITLRNNHRVSVPCFVYHDIIIWGATAMILSEFIELMTKALED